MKKSILLSIIILFTQSIFAQTAIQYFPTHDGTLNWSQRLAAS